MKNKKSCIDCLHCKVCAMSTKNSRLCFCSKTKNKERDLEIFWRNKNVCKKFVDMVCKINTHFKRR